jgi:S1-C subfamily serine protease
VSDDVVAPVKLAAAVVVAVGGIGGAIWYSLNPPPAKPKPLAPPAQAAAPRPEAAPSPVQVVAPPPAPDGAQLPTRPPASAASLEDVVSAAMPAVVRLETGSALGSGFFVTRDTLLTNVHVVAGASTVTVRLSDGRAVQGRVEQTAPDFDIAVVKVADPDGSASRIVMGSALRTRPGQEVVALGSPLGLQNTVTRGIVSALRQVGAITLVQTDAAINPGNSGGPLLDRNGRVIAIATMTVKPDVGQGLSFGVAIEHAEALLEGRLVSSSSALSFQGLSRGLAPPTPPAPPRVTSSADDAQNIRARGAREFEQAVTRVAQEADRLDERWRDFARVCYRGHIGGAFDRPSFAVFDPRAMQGTVPRGCEQTFAELERSAREIRETIRTADEAARRADVYPGDRRDLLRRYRLDYAGLLP